MFVNKVEYVKVKDIDFMLVRKFKVDMEKFLNDFSLDCEYDESK